MTVFRAATLRTFFFAFHAGAKELKRKAGGVFIPKQRQMYHFLEYNFSKVSILEN